MSYTLIEPCCGSFALTLHMLGAKRPLMPYQGSKWKHRVSLERIMNRYGFSGPPNTVVFADTGPWAATARCILDRGRRAKVIEYLEEFNKQDPRAVFDILTTCGIASDPRMPLHAAEHLFLQRLSFSGKAVWIGLNGEWKSPGFNKTSAYGTPATDRFGAVKPMIPSLIKTLVSYATLPDVCVITEFTATGPRIDEHLHRDTVMFLDPPYAKGTPYPSGTLDRKDVIKLAKMAHSAGAFVMISESEPLDSEIDELRWSAYCIDRGRNDTSPFRGQQPEWVTHNRNLRRSQQ